MWPNTGWTIRARRPLCSAATLVSSRSSSATPAAKSAGLWPPPAARFGAGDVGVHGVQRNGLRPRGERDRREVAASDGVAQVVEAARVLAEIAKHEALLKDDLRIVEDLRSRDRRQSCDHVLDPTIEPGGEVVYPPLLEWVSRRCKSHLGQHRSRLIHTAGHAETDDSDSLASAR